MKRTYQPVLVLVTVTLTIVAPVVACLWDYDTLRAEAKGMPSVAETITGRFERNPPLYYEMRLEQSAQRISRDAHDWAAYDNAGVACDRLGRHDEAIEWMQRKHAAMQAASLDEPTHFTHRYRYLANLGTFHAHRWLARGGDRDDTADLQRGIELIEAAIELNPDAHFGRERYQLMAMRWIIDPPPLNDSSLYMELPHFLYAHDEFRDHVKQHGRLMLGGQLAAVGLDDAVNGITGLIALGNAWESVDVFYALAIALRDDGQAALGRLAVLRCIELIESGATSLHPNAPTDEELIDVVQTNIGYMTFHKDDIEAYFAEARSAADAWHAHRTGFMLQRLKAGLHPDTHEDFWDGYVELPAIPMPNRAVIFGMYWSDPLVLGMVGLVIACLAAVAARGARLRRLRKRARLAAQQ